LFCISRFIAVALKFDIELIFLAIRVLFYP
jgi:hypothetical protein